MPLCNVLAAVFFPFSFEPCERTGAADFSSLLDAPAGKHGFVRVEGGRFAAGAREIRFNGVNLTGGANFPSHATAEKLAAHFASFGLNCVRLHYMDCPYDNFRQGPEKALVVRKNELEFEFDAERLDRLDFLVAALKRRGIYVNVNLRVARDERKKGATYIDEGLMATQRDYAVRLLRHVNPYTGLAYAEDPAVALVEVTNEDSMIKKFAEPLKWPVTEYTAFLLGREKAFHRSMAAFLKSEVGVKVPVTGTQISYDPYFAQTAYDYHDDHVYWRHPEPDRSGGGWAAWKMTCDAMVLSPSENALTLLASRRPYGKPYTVSEYNHPFPNPYGAEGAPLSHAFAAREGWNGLFIYSWDNRADRHPDHVDYFFSIAARADVLAHLPVCAALYLRGDMARSAACDPPLPTEEEWKALCATNSVPMKSYAARTGLSRDFSRPPFVWKDGCAVVSTPGAKFFTGFPRGRSFDLGDGVNVSVGETELGWATVSLVRNGGSWLVAVTGAARNTGVEKPAGRDFGRGPYLVEGVPARLSIPGASAAWALDGAGRRRESVSLEGGVLAADARWKTLWYEVEVR